MLNSIATVGCTCHLLEKSQYDGRDKQIGRQLCLSIVECRDQDLQAAALIVIGGIGRAAPDPTSMTGGNCEKCKEKCLVSSRKTYHMRFEVVQRIYIVKLIINAVSCLHQTK